MKKLVIFGITSMAKQVYAILSFENLYEISAFTVHKKYLNEKKCFNLPMVPFERIEKTHPPDEFAMVVAIGYKRVNKARAEVYKECKAKGYELISYISPRANSCGHLEIGDNTLIFGGSGIGPFTKIGNDCVIGGAIIGHNSIIGDHCYVAGSAHISGNVKIGDYCFVGSNATISDGVFVAPDCVIGAGAIILKDTKQGGVYVSQNAKMAPFKSHDPELKFFR